MSGYSPEKTRNLLWGKQIPRAGRVWRERDRLAYLPLPVYQNVEYFL
jgi:hypothetical protein